MDRYDEALAKARAEYEKAREQGYTWLMNLLEGMFQDLKESDDERIRIKMIDHFKAKTKETWCNMPVKDIIAYLEKQKDLNKMIVVSPEVWDNAISDAFENGKKEGEKQRAKERLDRMAPIYNDKESFESALEKAWKYYNESASRTVDSFEDDYIECVFSKGFREGFLYREKQKKQKLVKCIEFDNEFENQVSHLLASILNEEYKYNKGFVKYTAQSLLGYAKNELKPDEWDKREKLFMKALQTANIQIGQLFEENQKLKEQKLAECNEKHIANIFEKVGLAKIAREQRNDELTNALQDAMLELSKVKNAEWNEEEQQIIENAACTIISFSNTVETKEEEEELCELASKLQDLKPQPKPTWSEEDEKRIKQLIYDTEFVKAHYEKRKEELGEQFNNILIEDCDEQIAWLKSLRPPQYCENCKLKRSVENWKPSEEQMEALSDAYVEASTFKKGDILESLYNDLKKLM